MSRQYIYQLFMFKQQILKFCQDTLLHFIFKSLKMIAENYELLQAIFEHVLN